MLEPPESAAAAETLALEFSNVTKTYRLYGSLREQAMDVLGIRIPFLKEKRLSNFVL